MATINDVYNEIDRIEAAKEAIEGAIEERGIEVPGDALLGDLPPLIRQIPGPVQADWNEDDPDAPDYIKNKPTIPSAPGTLDTNNEGSQEVSGSESLSGNVKLHKISKTGRYSDLLDKPNIPSAQIQSNWDESDDTRPDFIKNKPTIPAAQIQSDWEQSNSEAKDFIKNKPTIPAAQVQSDWDEADSQKPEFIKNKPTIPTVPQMSTNVAADKNSNDKTASAKAVYDEVHPEVQSVQPAGGMLPNILYNFGQLSGNTTFSLGAVVAGIVNHYYWMFDTAATAPTITWPSGLSWFGGSAPEIGANKHYEISVLNGIAIAMEV